MPVGTITASAASYDASAAVSFANSHWNDGVGLCAEFVSRCLSAGGVTIPNYCYYSASQQSYQNNSGTIVLKQYNYNIMPIMLQQMEGDTLKKFKSLVSVFLALTMLIIPISPANAAEASEKDDIFSAMLGG